ncbi:MAG: ATP-binding protein [Actinomycetaceae bacterium]|nr:ATP-binding protein [Actinomycetaceae bacterium]
MDRHAMSRLIDWKRNPRRKPLILNGARQVGKTWLLREFGAQHFENVAYISLDNSAVARAIFDTDPNPHRIIREISILTGRSIKAESTLIIFDEIQAAPRAITALKYFCEEAPEYAICAAGSLLGISIHEGSGYPVGKVNTINLYPLSFREYLDANDNRALRELLDSQETESINTFGPKAISLLREYYVVGGMPSAVSAFIEGASLQETREIQLQLLQDYTRDFSKHAPGRVFPRMIELWDSIPSHLSQENKKLIFGRVRHGARSKNYEESLIWLTQAGFIHQVPRVTKAALPLSAYNDHRAFKAFLLDVGLLGALADLPPESLLDGNRLFSEFKGALTEQYVCQQLISDCSVDPYYWSADNSSGEIDFLTQKDGKIYAIEVKAEENLRAKSLRFFKEKNPEVHALRFSLSGYRDQEWMRNIPLYALGNRNLWS